MRFSVRVGDYCSIYYIWRCSPFDIHTIMNTCIQKTVLIIFLVTAVDGFFFDWFNSAKTKKWSDLQVTFLKFNHLPVTSKDAEDSGWTKTASCSATSYFRGNRYVLNNDKSTMVLYDSKGDFAGIQFGIAKMLATDKSFENKTHWIEEGNTVVITAYFTHPSGICNGRRTEDNLYIQVGPSPNNLTSIPYLESNIGSTRWVKGKCFWAMGQHYWYDISKGMSCDDLFPVFLLYNSGKLTGFGWAMIADLDNTRVEHPTPDKFKYFVKPGTQPECLQTVGTLTTQHIYLKNYPSLILCNPFSG